MHGSSHKQASIFAPCMVAWHKIKMCASKLLTSRMLLPGLRNQAEASGGFYSTVWLIVTVTIILSDSISYAR